MNAALNRATALATILTLCACGGSGAAATGTGPTPAPAGSTNASTTVNAAATTYTCPVASTSTGPLNCAALPLGDLKYRTTSASAGSVYVCSVPSGGAGSTASVPWIDTTANTWDALTKVVVLGAVAWPGTFSAIPNGSDTALDITGNGLPLAPVTTGTFPIATTDPAHQYDGNPNAIAAQSIAYALPYNPTAAATPGCVGGGRIGIAVNGVSIYDAFDALGHDAVAHEEQDGCHGHPDQSSTYHYHGWLQACVPDGGSATQNSSLLGYALDGYGIYGPWYDGKILTSADLDACHGTTSVVTWHGTATAVYHYVSTYDFPYTIGCYHGTPVNV